MRSAHGNSLDHLVGGEQQTGRHLKAERSGGLQIDDELELGRLGDWQLGRLCAVQDLASIDAGLTKTSAILCRSSSGRRPFDIDALGISRGNPISCRQGGKLHTAAAEEGVGGNEQRFGTLARNRGEGRIDLAAVTGVENLDLQPEIACRFLHRSQSGLGSRNIARV
jgi:hypothetical protein